MRAVNVLVTLVLVLVSRVEGQPRVKLSPETLEAFESYVEESERLLEKRLGGELPFLWTDDDPRRREELRNGEILIETPAGVPDIKGGLLHVWLGAMFVPEATGPRVLGVLQDYDRHQDWYPEVVDSKLLGSDGDTLSGYQRLLKKKVLTAVLNTRHEARYGQVSEGRWAGSSRSTRIVREAPGLLKWRMRGRREKGSCRLGKTAAFCGDSTSTGASKRPRAVPLSSA